MIQSLLNGYGGPAIWKAVISFLDEFGNVVSEAVSETPIKAIVWREGLPQNLEVPGEVRPEGRFAIVSPLLAVKPRDLIVIDEVSFRIKEIRRRCLPSSQPFYQLLELEGA